MVKQNAEPISAITRSNDGQRMAMTRMTIVVNALMEILRHPRVNPERPTKLGESGTCPGCKPRKLSTVVKIGRALRGILVMGMIAMHMTISTEIAFGYPSVTKIFDVTSSRIPLPNMRNPAMAMLKSKK